MSQVTFLLMFVALVFVNTLSIFAQQNPIQIENARTDGASNNWQIRGTVAAWNREIEGYASKTSVNLGETISFHVSVNPTQLFKIEIYRMGWYGGYGGRLVY